MQPSAKAELICVDPARVSEFWPHVRGLIIEAMRRGDLSAYWPVESAVLQGRALLWLVWNGQTIEAATITEICQSEWRKVCVIVACGGKDMSRWLPLLDGIEQYAKAEGCSATRIMGREGWQRALPDYRRTKIVLEKELA
jgi:hypothetical protein